MDGTGEDQDVTTSGTQEGTSDKAPTYTEAQAKKMVNDALSAAGREAKALADQRKAVEDQANRFEAERLEWQRRQDEAELATVRDNPDKLSEFQRRQRIRQQEAELERRAQEQARKEQEYAERVRAEEATHAEREAQRLAEKYGVDASILQLVPPENREKLAQSLPRKEGGTPPLKTDPGVTLGSGKGFRDIERGYAEGKVSRTEYEKARKSAGI